MSSPLGCCTEDVLSALSRSALRYSNAAMTATSAAPVPVDRPSNGTWISCVYVFRMRVPCNVTALLRRPLHQSLALQIGVLRALEERGSPHLGLLGYMDLDNLLN